MTEVGIQATLNDSNLSDLWLLVKRGDFSHNL